VLQNWRRALCSCIALWRFELKPVRTYTHFKPKPADPA
jgi:hypothetical protein